MNTFRPRLALALAALALLAAPAASAGRAIVVHGHWTIKVYDRHGRLVRERRFENALQTGGKGVLAGLLSGNFSVGGWEITLSNGGSTVGSADEDGAPCIAAGTCGTLHFDLLPTALTLTALIPPRSAALPVKVVDTAVWMCPGPGGSGGCNAQTSGAVFHIFTRKSLSPSIPVQMGQSVSVKVELTFS
jgi:hypothetical protein